MSLEVKRCPKCGGIGKIRQQSGRSVFYVVCENCRAHTELLHGVLKVIGAWNARRVLA